MDEPTLRQTVLDTYRLRIEPEMTRYALAQLQQGTGQVHLLGGDARTGVPTRAVVSADSLRPQTSK